ncbi:MAG: hypothetical protein KatS3mg008_0194 [Acidimicrobiales bacterium]|nr:MAG: hypothetical protein KatS3mg008_0194 [Acidimicrobiales bacterium]
MTNSARDERIPALDGIRGLAIAAVVAFHQPFEFARGGFLGVSTFFTLSGFLIGRNLLGELEENGSLALGRFWERRARRLLPPIVVCVLLVLVYSWLTRDHVASYDRLRGDLLAALGYVANWRFLLRGETYLDVFLSDSPVLHFWSLAIEEQFYVLLPLLLLASSRTRRAHEASRALVVATAGAAVVWHSVLAATGAGHDRIYLATDARLAELLVGVALAAVWRGNLCTSGLMSSLVGVVAGLLTLLSYVLVDLTWVRSGFLAAFAIVSAGLVGGAAVPGPTARLLGFRPLVALGRISYGVYVYHWPVFLWTAGDPWKMGEVGLFVFRAGLTLALATLSYHLLEMPIRERRVLTRMAPAKAGLALSSTGAAVLVVTALLPSTEVALGSSRPTPKPPHAPVPVLMVATDRPLAPLASALEEWTGIRGEFEVVPSVASTCGPAEDTRPGRRIALCRGWLDTWARDVRRFDPEIILLAVSDDSMEEFLALHHPPTADTASKEATLRRGLSRLADVLSERGAKLAVAPALPLFFPKPFDSEGRVDSDVMLAQLERTHARVGALTEPGELVWPSDLISPMATDASETGHSWARPIDRGWAAAVVEVIGPRLSRLLDGEPTAERTRIMVVGDSVASSMATGLEAWADDSRSALVWNVAIPRCGILRGGRIVGVEEDRDPPQRVCEEWPRRWRDQIEDFRPDVVVVSSGFWDLTDRLYRGSSQPLGPGDRAFDERLISDYVRAAKLLSSKGAVVVWLTSPCMGPIFPGQLADNPAHEPARTRHLNERILPKVERRVPSLRLVDLFGHVCPDGEFESELGGIPHARPDGLHFSPAGARWLAEWLGPLLLDIRRES